MDDSRCPVCGGLYDSLETSSLRPGCHKLRCVGCEVTWFVGGPGDEWADDAQRDGV